MKHLKNKCVKMYICKNNDVCAEVFRFVNNRLDLNSFCDTPVNCVLVMYCISVNFNVVSSLERLNSMSNIQMGTLALFAENTDYLRGREFRKKKLSLLAFTSFLLIQLVFEQTDLDRFGIGEDEASTFLTTRLGEKANLKLMKDKVHLKSYFSRLFLQEFFAALYLILFMDLDEFEQTLCNFRDSKCEMVTKFAFGLGNSTTQQCLQETVPLEEFNLSNLQKKERTLEGVSIRASFFVEKFDDLSQLFSWLYELRDDGLSEEVISNLKREFQIKLENSILPTTTPAYQYALQWKKTSLYMIEWFDRYVRNH